MALPKTDDLAQLINSPELALQHLSELLTLVQSDDETTLELASEALENCGAPSADAAAFLTCMLQSDSSQQIYWASTLLGRMGPVAKNAQSKLREVLNRQGLELSAREQAAWCLGQLGLSQLNEETKSEISKQLPTAPPRLKRLLEGALTASE